MQEKVIYCPQKFRGNNPPTGNRFLFTGREWDSETGLYHYRARAYNPQIGRFLQRDPVEAINLYDYVGNNPLSFRDPHGLYGEDVHYWLTEVIALAVCFTPKEAEDIAYADNYTDFNTKTAPWNPLAGDLHFPLSIPKLKVERGSQEAWKRAINAQTLGDLGTGLHVLQDSYSHEGLDKVEHIKKSIVPSLFGGDPDKTSNDPKKATDAMVSTYAALSIYRKRQNLPDVCRIEWTDKILGTEATLGTLVFVANVGPDLQAKMALLDAIAKKIVEKKRCCDSKYAEDYNGGPLITPFK